LGGVGSCTCLFSLGSAVAVGSVAALAGRCVASCRDGFSLTFGVFDAEAWGDASEDHQDSGDYYAQVEGGGWGVGGLGGQGAVGDVGSCYRGEAGADYGAEDGYC